MEFLTDSPTQILHLLWLLPLLAGVIGFARQVRLRRLSRLIPEPSLQDRMTATLDRRRRRLRLGLLATALSLLVVCLARIQALPGETLTRPARGRDVLVVFDVSRSMLATDVEPSRLEHARRIVRDLAERLPGDRFGLVAFSGSAFVQCPLTFNHPSFQLILDDLDTLTIPVGGSNLEKALQVSLGALAAAEGPHQAIVVISDGEELQGDAGKVLKILRRRHVPVHVIGVGDPELGSFIPLPQGGLLEDGGKPVRSRLNEGLLKRIAAAGNGLYVHSTAEQPATDRIAEALAALIPARHDGDLQTEKPRELFQWPLGVAVVLLLMFLAGSERRRMAGLAPVLFVLAVSAGTAAEREDETARRLRAAIEAVGNVEELARLQYNLARHLQDKGKFEDAEKYYDQVLSGGGAGSELRAAAVQNLGVMLHVSAAKSLKTNPAGAVERLRQCIRHYTEALRLLPGNRELAANLELARRDLQKAHEYLKIESRLKEELARARRQTRQALNDQRRANAKPADTSRQEAATRSAADAQAAVQQLVETATHLNREKDYAAAERRISRARGLQDKLSENQDNTAGKRAADLLLEALVLLGGQPDSKQRNDQQKPNKIPKKEGNPTTNKAAEQLKILEQLAKEEEKLRRQQKEEKARYREPESRKNW